jgi:hypothetical protein
MSAIIQNLPEIKIVINSVDLIPSDMVTEREQYLLCASGIKSITTPDENSMAGQTVVEMRKHVKAVEEMRVTRTRPLLDAQKLLKGFCDSHTECLLSEIGRLQRLGTAFVESENRRVEAEEKKRREEFEAAQAAQLALDDAARKASESGSITQQMIANRKLESAKINVQEIINAPEPVAIKAKGQTMKQVLRYEVTDIFELVKARPDLCKIEAKASAINSSCHPNHPIPGLKIWFENVSTYTTR